jgi:hypothetical protein
VGSYEDKRVYEDDELEPEILTYREFQRQRALVDWYERRRLHECGIARNAAAGGFAVVRNAVAQWVVELASRGSGRSLFRRLA